MTSPCEAIIEELKWLVRRAKSDKIGTELYFAVRDKRLRTDAELLRHLEQRRMQVIESDRKRMVELAKRESRMTDGVRSGVFLSCGCWHYGQLGQIVGRPGELMRKFNSNVCDNGHGRRHITCCNVPEPLDEDNS